MTTRIHGVMKRMNQISTLLLLLIAAGWVAALAAGVASLWTGNWLSGGFYSALLGTQTWILSAVQRGSPPSGGERVGIAAVSILVLILSIAIVMQRFVS
ncbi:MAG: hypothetical protein EA351_13635 [Gemmatimonadales bacterium]|nr:MAG: hypothetical protein EA351_13635 [Gemmatimonadales bacterium]